MLSKELLKVLACPCCKADLNLVKTKLVCVKCEKEFEVVNDVPRLICD